MDSSGDGLGLVTGATGFIGGHLARRLTEQGHHVRCLVRASSDTSRLQALGVEIAVGDLRDPHSLARAAHGCRYVVHCAALVSDWASIEEIRRANVGGTRNVLQAAISASVERFVHLSTTDVYGYPGGAAIDETHPPARFRNWYAHTKRAAETEVRRAAEAAAMDVVILRPSTVYGPGSVEVVAPIARALCNRSMLLIDRGRAVAGLCYVENLVDAMLLALRERAALGHAFNVSDGLPITWKQFTDALARGLGCPEARWSLPLWLATGIAFLLEYGYRFLRKTTGLTTPPLLSRQAVHVLGMNQDFSNRKLRRLLGWEPRTGYAAGLEATLAWLRDDRLAGVTHP